MTQAADFTGNELLTCVIARAIQDDDLIFVGVGTNGRAFTLAVGIPLTAVRLAQRNQAPGALVYWGNLLDPDLSHVPRNINQDTFTRWPAAACPPDTGYKCDMLARHAFDVSFSSGAQIDRYGNLNITAIGDYRRPKVRLVGSLAQPEHLAFVRRPIIIMDLGRRSFVEKVDFITSVGHYRGGTSRTDMGLDAGGPVLVVTDKALFDFDPTTKEMRLASVHPGVTVDEVLDLMGFQPKIEGDVPVTAAPTAEELREIREIIDPERVLLRV
jgi:glutaconate CoA-transferase subunit B